MIKVFKNNAEYIDNLTCKEIKKGEVFCLNFLPSAFFPKDIIDYFFDKKEHINGHKEASDKLWRFGKKVIKKLKSGSIQIGVELKSLKEFVEKGIVHEATQNFEATLATRIHVIDIVIRHINHIYFIPEPTPYVFRLIPNETVILDVDRNKTAQTIQGLLIKNIEVYNDFALEYERLKTLSINNVNKGELIAALTDAKTKLKSGVHTTFKT